MGENKRMHDGIAGAVMLLGTLLGYFLNPYWLLVPGVIGALMLQSTFSGFCPVYFTLGKLRTPHQTRADQRYMTKKSGRRERNRILGFLCAR